MQSLESIADAWKFEAEDAYLESLKRGRIRSSLSFPNIVDEQNEKQLHKLWSSDRNFVDSHQTTFSLLPKNGIDGKTIELENEDGVVFKEEENELCGWGIAIMASCFFLNALAGHAFLAFAVLYIEFCEAFNESNATIGAVGAVRSSVGHLLTGLLAGALVQQLGCRKVTIGAILISACGFTLTFFTNSTVMLFIVYGGLSGTGSCVLFLTANIKVQQYFNKRRAFAAGIVSMGLSVGTLSTGPLMRYLINIYGWRGAVLLQGAIFLQGLVAAAAMQPRKTQKSRSEVNKAKFDCKKLFKNVLDFSLLKDSQFVCYIVGSFLMLFGFMAMYQHIVNRAIANDISRNDASTLSLYMGLTSLIGRFIFSFVASAKFVNRNVLYSSSICLGGLVLVISSIWKTYIGFAFFAFLYSVFNSCYFTVQGTVLTDNFGRERIPKALSFLSVVNGLAATVCIPFVGWIYDSTQDYDIPFYVVGTLQFIGGILTFGLMCFKKKSIPLDEADVKT